MKKLKFLGIAALALACGMCVATGCGSGNGGGGSASNYTFEAEGVDFTGMSSFGYSINYNETDLIQGKNTPSFPSNVLNSISNSFFVGGFNTTKPEGLTLKFPIKADKASTGNVITLRLGTEFGTLRITPAEMDVIVNGVALEYDAITVVGENLTSVEQYSGYKVPFADYKLSSTFDLVAGDNLVEVKIKKNNLGFKDEPMLSSVGPGVDCIKIKSESVLSWESLWEDNKLEAGIQD